jgi:hypothetical protein
MGWEGKSTHSRPPSYTDFVDHALAQVDESMMVMAMDARNAMVDNTQRNTPVSDPSPGEPVHLPHLRDEIEGKPVIVEPRPNGRVYETGAVTFVEYAPYVEDGTGMWGPHHAPYPIEPTPGGLLSWVGPDGKRRFAKRVMHPGSPGQHMFAIGAALTEHEFERIADHGLREWERRVEAWRG